MGLVKFKVAIFIFCAILLSAFQGFAGEKAGNGDPGDSGIIEIECNISSLELHLCPREKYETKEKRVLFGLIKSEKHLCSGGELSLGETPVKPMSVAAGKYILLVPGGYRSKHEGPIEIDIERGKRQFIVLKLFSARADGVNEDAGAAGAGGGAGGSAGVAPGPGQ